MHIKYKISLLLVGNKTLLVFGFALQLFLNWISGKVEHGLFVKFLQDVQTFLCHLSDLVVLDADVIEGSFGAHSQTDQTKIFALQPNAIDDQFRDLGLLNKLLNFKADFLSVDAFDVLYDKFLKRRAEFCKVVEHKAEIIVANADSIDFDN